jgi:hypothetical protein
MDTVKFKYKFDQNYNPKYINGAIGGVSPMGDIVINFYLERPSLPKQQDFEVDNTIGIGKLVETDPTDFDKSYVRFIENGIVMNYKTAKEVHKWLGEHIENLEMLM